MQANILFLFMIYLLSQHANIAKHLCFSQKFIVPDTTLPYKEPLP